MIAFKGGRGTTLLFFSNDFKNYNYQSCKSSKNGVFIQMNLKAENFTFEAQKNDEKILRICSEPLM